MTFMHNKSLCFIGSGSIIAENMAAIEVATIAKLLAGYYPEMVYGGSTRGLMGVFAKEFFKHNQNVISVYPKWLDEAGLLFDGGECLLAPNLSKRKQIMFERCSDIVCFPGGTGTLDELFTYIEMGAVGEVELGAVYLYNHDRYYEKLLENLASMAEKKMIRRDIIKCIHPFCGRDELKGILDG